MFRRQARLRREYLYRKSIEDRHRKIQEKKERIKRSLEQGTTIETTLRKEAVNIVHKLDWEDSGPKLAVALGSEEGGVPNSLVVCHLPYGPTAYFTMADVTMRHDIPDIGTMSEQYPHLIFHNFTTKLGVRTSNILKYLFPVPKEESKRVITFANHDDYISFRHHTYKKVIKSSVVA
ncbi:snoRNA-binding rRNA-processing protein imp4 [Homalodisca vitripennis]|nr:snoRNA-binding rRNA-processing protein imp4 [Homalodisca vitripennis]